MERFKQESIYRLSAGTKISGHCREVAIVGSRLLVEVELYFETNSFLEEPDVISTTTITTKNYQILL